MKVVFCIPAIDGKIMSQTHQSLVATYKMLEMHGIAYDELIISDCAYLPVARSTLVAMFMHDPNATDLFFVDSDVAFGPEAVMHVLARPEEIVAGVYPLKQDEGGYPVVILSENGSPKGRDGLIEATLLPTGFMRIKRGVFELMAEAYPELKYEESYVEVRDAGITEAYDFFGMGNIKQRYTTEDFYFCHRWRAIGGQCWVYPDINFRHVGRKAYRGNYKHYLEAVEQWQRQETS